MAETVSFLSGRDRVEVSSTTPLPVTLGASATIDIGDVQVLAGTAIIGKVGIDQTTDGTTNLVAAKQSGTWKVEQGPFLLGRATADAQIKGSAGLIHTISIAALTATPTAGLLTVYDSLTETGTVVYAEWVLATVTGHTVILDVPVGTGIYVGFDATLASIQATISYR